MGHRGHGWSAPRWLGLQLERLTWSGGTRKHLKADSRACTIVGMGSEEVFYRSRWPFWHGGPELPDTEFQQTQWNLRGHDDLVLEVS